MPFQFPSNGKLHSNEAPSEDVIVFPRFQFPSNGKLHSNVPQRHRDNVPCVGFNSLQTGNCIQTAISPACSSMREPMFQFPSNGKLHSNMWGVGIRRGCMLSVSIPFKRETAFKHPIDPSNGWNKEVSIPFKRETAFKRSTNYGISRNNVVSIPFKRETAFKPDHVSCVHEFLIRFQFPSNGKLHSNFFIPAIFP